MDAAQRVLRARLGGYAAAARNDSRALNAKARATYRDGFRAGHGCALCPTVDLPADLSEAERARRAEALRRLHFGRLAFKSAQRRKHAA